MSTLKRNLGINDVVALGINGVVGSGIFFLLDDISRAMGPSAIIAIVLAGLLSFLIALCFAEVGSQFDSTGGAYVFARKAFGDFVGFEVGWMTCIVAIAAWAALANVFVDGLIRFFPTLDTGLYRNLAISTLVLGLSAVNVAGVRNGARLTNFFTAAKLLPIFVFIAAGVFFISGDNFSPFFAGEVAVASTEAAMGIIAQTTLVILYAFVGFEALVVPAGEMANPTKSIPRAMLLVMVIVSTIYVGLDLVAVGTLPTIANESQAVPAAATGFLGEIGGQLIGVGIVISILGVNSGSALIGPRRFFAMSENGHLPKIFSYTHPKTGAPVYAIAITAVLTLALAFSGSFKQLALLGVIARFAQYMPTCLAVLTLRRKFPDRDTYRIPGGPAVPISALILCLILLSQAPSDRLLWGSVGLLSGAVIYVILRFTYMRHSKE